MFSFVSAWTFSQAVAQAPRSEMLTPYSAEEYAQGRCFLSADKTAGYAILGTELVSLFNRGARGSGRLAIPHALRNGARTLCCFDGFLPELYTRYGFMETRREPWNNAYAPTAWDYTKHGRPDVVWMHVVSPTWR